MQLVHRGSSIQVLAPAKINLFLEIIARRDDGFHELETLMVAINIFDTVTFSSTNEDHIQLEGGWAGGWQARQVCWQRQQRPGNLLAPLPVPEANLVVQAARRLQQAAGISRGARIRLTKRIPSEAGLGGASSDAAATLLAANQAWALHWPLDRLAPIAAELGSDVPFFLETGWAVCRGRGERIERLSDRLRLDLVVVRPPVGLSTAAVYRGCRVPSQPRSVRAMVEALHNGSRAAVGQQMHNQLQASARNQSPWVDRLANWFSREDVWGHQLSGSGSSYFGICRNARHARRVASRLQSVNPGLVWTAHTQ